METIAKAKYLAIIISVSFVFLLGILIGKTMTEMDLSSYTNTASALKTNILSLTTQQDLIAENICNFNILNITRARAVLGSKVDGLEKSLGKENPQTLALKREYSLISIRQWLLVKDAKTKCGYDTNIVLFFYSNIYNKEKSELQGYVLDYFYRKNPEKIVTYSFDSDLEEPTIATLMELYNITEVPSVVINDKAYLGYRDREALEPLIK